MGRGKGKSEAQLVLEAHLRELKEQAGKPPQDEAFLDRLIIDQRQAPVKEVRIEPLDTELEEVIRKSVAEEAFSDRLERIMHEIELGMKCSVSIGRDQEISDGRFYFQIMCWRLDVITGEMGWGYGGKAYLSPHATDSELVQTVFGLYRAYWEHEARETFVWRGRRVFGPHIATEALWGVAQRVDVRSAKHVEDRK